MKRLHTSARRALGIPASWLLGCLLSPSLAAPLAAQDAPAPEEPLTLESLQKQVDELKATLAKTPRTGTTSNTMKVFGRTHLDFWEFTDDDASINVFETGDPSMDPVNGVEFRRARIGVSGSIHESMVYKTELEFGHTDELSFKDMYFGFEGLPVVQTLLIGNQKRPYGLDHLNSSRFNVFLERPFVVEALNQDARRLGIAAYGTDEDETWNWRYGVFNMTDWARVGEYMSDHLQPEVAGRLARTFFWEDDGRRYGHWAVSGSMAFPDDNPDPGDAANQARFRTRPEGRSASRWLDTGTISGIDRYALVGLEGVLNFGPTQVVAESMNAWVDRDGPDPSFPGGYVYVSHFLTGEHMPWERDSGTLGRPKPNRPLDKGGWGAWQVAARWSFADFSDDDLFGGRGQALTLGLNWFWNASAGLQLNYIHGEISERSETVGATTFTEGDYDIVGLRFRVDF